MPSQPALATYTARDAARASRNGAFITAWPPDEPYFAPSMDQLMRDMAPQTAKARAGASRNAIESLAQRPAKTGGR
ncbi:hypothetical protein E4U53_002978 [Claviceps sorghi]|nr:hypothetical protein E4U53_002978 [Claviceps sorghi]